MCKPASFVLTRDRVFWSMYTDSHTEIIKEFGLHEDGARGPNVVKVEISPEDWRLDSDPGMWVYKLDQDRTPEWYDPEECERRASAALAEWVAARVIREGNRELSRGEIFVCDNATATLNDSSAAMLYGNVRATLKDNATAALHDSSAATLYDKAAARLYDNAMATLYGRARATLWGNAMALFFDNAIATLSRNATARLYGNATATLNDRSTAVLWGDSTATLWGDSTATLYDNATAIRMSPGAVVIDRRRFPISVDHGDLVNW